MVLVVVFVLLLFLNNKNNKKKPIGERGVVPLPGSLNDQRQASVGESCPLISPRSQLSGLATRFPSTLEQIMPSWPYGRGRRLRGIEPELAVPRLPIRCSLKKRQNILRAPSQITQVSSGSWPRAPCVRMSGRPWVDVALGMAVAGGSLAREAGSPARL